MDIARFTAIRPEERQVSWQTLGFTAFLHYGMNTFTNREWGSGAENPQKYSPGALDTDQWCAVLKAAEIRACILTAKHHDGFCLWDTATTRHSVMASPVPTDVVAALAASCRKFGLRLGLYLSPWDRHELSYGTGKPYDDFFCRQLTELTAGYGELYAIWFDGACGEGANGKRQVYDWERYYAIIRQNQPGAVISVMGPDVRWIGNEAGETRTSEWSVVSARLRDKTAIAARSQQEDGLPPLHSMDADLGSLAVLAKEPRLCWYPAEVDVSIRPGWFFHPEENGALRSIQNLLDIYETSVGGNAVLLLNIPPDTDGLIHDADRKRLEELGELLRNTYGASRCADGTVRDEKGQPVPQVLTDDESYWRGTQEQAQLTVKLPGLCRINRMVLCEQIRESQRIETFTITAWVDGQEAEVYRGTTVGCRKICVLTPLTTNLLQITVTGSREYPTLRFIGAYEML